MGILVRVLLKCLGYVAARVAEDVLTDIVQEGALPWRKKKRETKALSQTDQSDKPS